MTGRETILVADDEPAVRRLARRALERRGYRVLEAGDGDEAFRCFEARADEIDLVVLDLTMPRADGLATLTRLRERWPRLPVVLASGHLDTRSLSRRPEDLVTLAKPYTPTELARRVRETLDGAELQLLTDGQSLPPLPSPLPPKRDEPEPPPERAEAEPTGIPGGKVPDPEPVPG